MLKFVESVVLFVPDINAAANWYASLFGVQVSFENERYAYLRAPGVLLGFHPADEKCPGGVGGTTVYWEVDDLDAAVEGLVARGARLHRGPMRTSYGAGAAMLICPFGCTIGLNCSTPESRAAIAGQVPQAGGPQGAA
jgi:predicted enzyme related to lactoylglutathione lyase